MEEPNHEQFVSRQSGAARGNTSQGFQSQDGHWQEQSGAVSAVLIRRSMTITPQDTDFFHGFVQKSTRLKNNGINRLHSPMA